MFAEILVVFTIDPTCAIEGLAFDTFGNSEVQARQAASTSLSAYTICVASACTIGGIAYDFFSWKGTVTFHTICQSLLLFMLAIQPSMRQSFMEVWFPAKEPEKIEEDQVESSTRAPNTDAASGANGTFLPVLPGAVEQDSPDAEGGLVVEEVEESMTSDPQKPKTDATESRASRASGASGARQSRIKSIRHSERSRPRPSTLSARTHATAGTQATDGTKSSAGTHATAGAHASDGTKSAGAHATHVTARTQRTKGTSASGRTARTVLTAMSRMTALSEAGEEFRHHFGTSLATMPHIVGRTGAKSVLRDELEALDEDGNTVQEKAAVSGTGGTKARPKIPQDIRLPVFLIVLNCFTNTATYVIEFSTFAIFFKEVHSWNEATLASLAQTAGDVMAAFMMQVIPFLMPDGYDADEAGPCRRFWHSLTSQPYTITCVLVSWMVFNACLISPWLPIAIVAQVFMGTSYVYSCKWSTDMSLFYSLGDSQVFLAIQVLCRNADALGGGLGSIFGTWLFTFGPTVPFVFGTGFTTTVFLLYTVSFCARLGFGDDIEDAEAKRSRRLGKARVSSWAIDVSRKSQKLAFADEIE